MKGVFVYSNFDFSSKSAGVTRMLYYAQALANANTQVYLTSCSASAIEKDSFKEVLPNIFILENNTLTQSFFGTYGFVKDLHSFSKKNIDQSTFIFYPSPLLYLEVLALFYLKFIKKCALFYEFNEVRKYSSKFHEKGTIKKPKYTFRKILYKSIFSTLELLLYFYDGLICISSTIEKYGTRFNKSTIRIPILTNPDSKKEFSSINYSNSNSFNIGFSGKIEPNKENLLSFFNVLGQLKNEHINFILNLCGPIEKAHEDLLLDKVSEKLKIKENINYYGNLNSKELNTFLSQQQLLVIPRGYTLQNHYGFSTKLSDYLNHAKPILITDVSDNSLFIKDGENGFIVRTDDNDAMYQKIKYIVENYPQLQENIEREALKTSKDSFYFKKFTSSLNSFLFKN